MSETDTEPTLQRFALPPAAAADSRADWDTIVVRCAGHASGTAQGGCAPAFDTFIGLLLVHASKCTQWDGLFQELEPAAPLQGQGVGVCAMLCSSKMNVAEYFDQRFRQCAASSPLPPPPPCRPVAPVPQVLLDLVRARWPARWHSLLDLTAGQLEAWKACAAGTAAPMCLPGGDEEAASTAGAGSA